MSNSKKVMSKPQWKKAMDKRYVKRVLLEKLWTANRLNDDLVAKNTELDGELIDLDVEFKDALNEFRDKRREYAESEAEAVADLAKAEDKISKLTGQLGDVRMQLGESENRCSALTRECSSDRDTRIVLQRQVGDLVDERNEWEKQCAELVDQVDDLEHDIGLEQDEATAAQANRQKEFKELSDLSQIHYERALDGEENFRLTKLKLMKESVKVELLEELLLKLFKR